MIIRIFMVGFVCLYMLSWLISVTERHQEHCDMPVCYRDGHAHCMDRQWVKEHP